MGRKRYDIAVSYASEQRAYVERFVKRLEAHKLSVYYDRNAQAKMVGKILDQELHKIYIQESACCVLFLSEAYVTKPVTRYESQIILSETIYKDNFMYILKFDPVSIPGLNRNFIYSSIAEFPEPEHYADFMCEVVSGKPLECRFDSESALYTMLADGLEKILGRYASLYNYTFQQERQFGKVLLRLEFESSIVLQVQVGRLPGKSGVCLWIHRGSKACDDHAFQGYVTWIAAQCCYRLENRGLLKDLVPELTFPSENSLLERLNEEIQTILGVVL